jgi:hypothetical protein
VLIKQRNVTTGRPVVMYASETWVLKEAMIQKLMIFERKILRRIYGPTKEKTEMENQNQ